MNKETITLTNEKTITLTYDELVSFLSDYTYVFTTIAENHMKEQMLSQMTSTLSDHYFYDLVRRNIFDCVTKLFEQKDYENEVKDD